MTIIANATKTLLATIGLTCAIVVAVFITLAYTGNGEEIAQMSCAIQTDGIAEYSSCVYAAGADIDN